ncbi:MAG: hypothetical protein M0036_09355 [Desulfobacteraceae bacterium]|nr:hypothetical protein [Desulfobacteraceae bacterium]
MQILTFEELKQKQAEGMAASQKAAAQNHDLYRAIKQLVRQINAEPLDVADYYPVASRLGKLLNEIKSGFNDTIFHYFAEQIDPSQNGDVRCFRMECRQLAEQIEELDRFRVQRHRLTLVKKGCIS